MILFRQVHTDGNMAALDLVVNSFADVVQQAGALGSRHINTQLGGQQARNVRDLDRVVQNVLAVAGTVAHPAEKADQLGMEAVNVGLEYGTFAFGRTFWP